ncbi:MAG: hypothetical protein ABW032_05180 [Burkholderiaceae bacterium]
MFPNRSDAAAAGPVFTGEALPAAQVKQAAYYMRASALGQLDGTKFDGLRRMNRSLEGARGTFQDGPGNVENVINQDNEALRRLAATRKLAQTIKPQREPIDFAIGNATASIVMRGGAGGELATLSTIGAELEKGERVAHMVQPAADGSPLRAQNYAILYRGEKPGASGDIVANGLSEDPAMLLEHTTLSDAASGIGEPKYELTPERIPVVQQLVEHRVEEISQESERFNRHRIFNQAQLPTGLAPFATRPSIAHPRFVADAQAAIRPLSTQAREELAVRSIRLAVPELTEDQAKGYKDSVINQALAGS